MSEDTPLYGEQSPTTKIFLWVVQGVIASFVLFSVIVGIVFGIKRQGQHIMLVFVILDLTVLSFLFFRWYSNDSIDPKYKWLIVGFAATLIWACITLNAYAWPHHVDPSTQCNLGNGYYSFNSKTCLTVTNSNGINACVGRGFCMCLSQHQPGQFSAFCTNCTATPCNGIMAIATP